MIKLHFSEHDLERIQDLRKNHAHPRVRQRLNVLWMKHQGFSCHEIGLVEQITRVTITKYLRLYESGGLNKVMALNFYGPVSELEQHRAQLGEYFRDHPPATIKEAMAKIEELTGLKRSAGTVGKFLHSLGMTPRKVGSIPSKADPEAQERFLVNELEPRIEQAKQGTCKIFLSMPLTLFLPLFWVFFGH